MDSYVLNIGLGVGNLLCGCVFIALARPLVAGRISRNDYYGMRFKKALGSEENWIEINKVGGLQMRRWGKVVLVISITCFAFPPLPATGFWIWFFGLAPALILIACWQTYNFSKHL